MNTIGNAPARQSYPRPVRMALLCVFFFCLTSAESVSPGSTSVGQQTDGNADSPTGKALRTTPWFDAEQSSLKPIDIEPRTDDSLNRDSRWLPKPKPVTAPKSRATSTSTAANNGTPTGTGLFNSGFTALNLLGWLTLAVIVLAGVGAIFYVLSRADLQTAKVVKGGKHALSGKTPDEQTLERMKHLPEELRRTDVNLRSEAQRLMQSAQYDQAIILLFAHQLLLLDRCGILRLNRGKTNRKYIRETLATNKHAANCLEATVASFERSYFGRHKITRSEFADTWRLNEQLESGIEEQQGEAA